MNRDTVYLTAEPAGFIFNQQVAGVFDDMVQRSVPGYLLMQNYVCELLETLPAKPKTVLDIGCSTGTSMALIGQRFPGVHIVGFDSAPAMLEKAEANLSSLESNDFTFEFHEGDVTEVDAFPEADVVLLNLTLQFVRPLRRVELLKKLASAVRPGGVVILMEKVLEPSDALTRRLIKVHHEFKREQGYSDLEIARKREDIENVLIPLTVSENEELLRASGLDEIGLVVKVLNFTLIAGFKEGGDCTC
ncbi:methyltransferase domain-containing protein [Streptomyces sp. NPDC058286]|uniref:methyltransferase domain-containing protein n=1 Tax=Streptomyces sp. NPDC058286 TaxID=3346422 RepID=UPI0036E408F2